MRKVMQTPSPPGRSEAKDAPRRRPLDRRRRTLTRAEQAAVKLCMQVFDADLVERRPR